MRFCGKPVVITSGVLILILMEYALWVEEVMKKIQETGKS